MIAPLRRVHAVLWPVLVGAVFLLAALAVATRPDWNRTSPWPGAMAAGSAP